VALHQARLLQRGLRAAGRWAAWPAAGPEPDDGPGPSAGPPRGPAGPLPCLLGGCEILDSVGTDYRFRIFVPKDAWVEVVAALADETDYDNFKSAVAEHQGREGAAYERALHEVWDVMYGLQRGARL
jgi:hypothetical protein